MLPLILSITTITLALAAELVRRPLNISITDNSPLLIYRPEVPRPEENATRSGLAHQSWNVSFSGSKWSEWTPNRVGHGTSEHRVSWPNATVMFSFMGTRVDFLGSTGERTSIEFRLIESTSADGGQVSYSNENGKLASLEVAWGWHTVQLFLRTGTVALTGVQFTTEIESFHDSADDTLTVDVNARDGDGISPLIPNLQGSNTPGGKPWHVHDVICTSDDPVYWPRIDTWDKDAWATMAVPQNASYFTFWGSMNDDHRQYSIEIIPPAPGLPQGPQVFSGYTSWCTPDTLMYAGPLDPQERYRIRVINLVNDRVTDIKKATFWIANETSATQASAAAGAASSRPPAVVTAPVGSEKASLSPAAIAGITLGALAVLGAVALSSFLLMHRRKAQEKEEVEQYDLDENKHLVHRRSHSWGPSIPLSRSSGWTDSSVAPTSVAGASESPVTPPATTPARQRYTYATHTPQSSIGISSLRSIHEDSLYVNDTDAGSLPVLIMPPTYDPEWANERSPPLPAEAAEETGATEQSGVHPSGVYLPMSSHAYVGRSAHMAREAGTVRFEPRDARRTSGQVTQLLSELWGAPLQRNGSTWKPVRSDTDASVTSGTPRSDVFSEISGHQSRPSIDSKGPTSPKATTELRQSPASPKTAKETREEMIQQRRMEQRASRISRARMEGNYI